MGNRYTVLLTAHCVAVFVCKGWFSGFSPALPPLGRLGVQRFLHLGAVQVASDVVILTRLVGINRRQTRT